jgi:hypothetical protein
MQASMGLGNAASKSGTINAVTMTTAMPALPTPPRDADDDAAADDDSVAKQAAKEAVKNQVTKKKRRFGCRSSY